MVIIAILFSMIAVSLGLALSAYYDTPAGPSVVIAAAFLFTLSLFKSQQE